MHTTSRIHEIIGLASVVAVCVAVCSVAAFKSEGTLCAALFVFVPLAIAALSNRRTRARASGGDR
jgi:hypothetical protein